MEMEHTNQNTQNAQPEDKRGLIFFAGALIDSMKLSQHKKVYSAAAISIATFVCAYILFFSDTKTDVPPGIGGNVESYLKSISESGWAGITRSAQRGNLDAAYMIELRTLLFGESAAKQAALQRLDEYAQGGHDNSKLASAEFRITNGNFDDAQVALASLWELVKRNNVQATLDLAYCFKVGKFVPADPLRAVSLYESVADRSDQARREQLAILAELDAFEAVTAEEWKFVLNDSKNEKGYADYLLYLKERSKDEPASNTLNYLKNAAQHDFAPAQLQLSVLLNSGAETAVDEKEINSWLRALAEKNNVEAMWTLYSAGSLSAEEGAEMLWKIVSFAGNSDISRPAHVMIIADAMLEIGADDLVLEAFEYLQRASYLGYAPAKRRLAELLCGSVIDDPLAARDAVPLLVSLAQTGDPWASYQLGLAYQTGWAPQGSNPFQAAQYFMDALAGGHTAAIGEMEHAFRNGIGVEQDPGKADELLDLMVEMGLISEQQEESEK